MATTSSTRSTDIPIPLSIISRLGEVLRRDWDWLGPKSHKKLFTVLVELWCWIALEGTRQRGLSNSTWIYIGSRDLARFKIQLNGDGIYYSKLLGILEEAGVIETNDHWYAGAFTKAYRIPAGLDLGETLPLSIRLLYLTQKGRGWASKTHLQNQWPQWSRIIETLWRSQIQLEPFFKELDRRRGQPWRWDRGEEQILDSQAIYYQKLAAISFNLGLHYFSRHASGRIFTSGTNLSRLALPYLLIDGQPVVEIDCVNSQILLLTLLIDHPEFKKDAECGRVYEKTARRFNRTRDWAKGWWFSRILFSSKCIRSTDAEQLETIWPGLVEQIRGVRSRPDAPQEEQLWFRLQQIESDIWIRSAQAGGNWVITRHDALVAPQTHLWYWRSEILNKYKQLGLDVELKITPEI